MKSHRLLLAVTAIATSSAWGCGGGNTTRNAAETAAGGALGVSGATALGGRSSAGGAKNSGGVAVGGTATNGKATGGASNAGGAGNAGSSNNQSGTSSTVGGLATSGGNIGTGGSPSVGGNAGTGGANVTGGSTTKGATGTGGTNTGLYVLPTDRATSWNLSGMLTKGGIPSASWPICNSTPLTPSGGSDDSAQINAKIASCAAGSVVMLGSGTFKMGQGNYISLDKGVVLRGAGAGRTILKNPLNVPATQSNEAPTDTTAIAIIGPAEFGSVDGDGNCNKPTAYQTAYMQLLAADGSKGSTSVTVASGAIFKAGQFVLLDEASNATWQPDVVGMATSVWASADYAVQWTLHKPALQLDDLPYNAVTPSTSNNWAGIGTGADAACWFSRSDRPQNEIKEVASVSGNTVTFTSPLHKNYRTANHAELTTYTGSNVQLQNAGIENLSLIGGGNGALRFENAAYCWAKNVEVTTWYGEGVSFNGSFRVELRDSYVHDAAWAEPGGAGYAISLSGASSELLIENNISIKANKVMVARSSGSGSVVAYNYMDDGYIATSETWIEIGLNASHMVGSHHVLFEGNQSFNMDSDDTHGNSTYHTYFRNWTTTVRAKFQSGYSGNTIDDANTPGNSPRRAAAAMRYTYNMSFVGNVLGQSGITTAAHGYVDDSPDGSDAIWILGWNDISPYTMDTKVAPTTLRDGNWDWFLGKQTWLTNSAAPLPNSLYLSSKPTFFGSNTWPWVDPTTGTVNKLPAKVRYDAGTPNTVP